MKPASFLVPLFVCVITLTQCTTKPPPAPGDTVFSGEQSTAYRRGYYLGFQDGKWKREEDFEHYYSDYKAETRDAFERGYHLGYENGKRDALADPADKDRAYNDGYEAGRSDFENSLRPSPERYRARFSAATEYDFRRGYVAGFDEAHHDGGSATDAERVVYNRGYSRGADDATKAHAPHGDELARDLPAHDADFFLKGYRDGFNQRTPRY